MATTTHVPVSEQLARWSRDRRDDPAFGFITRRGADPAYLSWGDLSDSVRPIAANIRALADDRRTGILILCRSERNYVIALAATLWAGATAIPAPIALNYRLRDRLRQVSEWGDPDIVLHDLPPEELEKAEIADKGRKVLSIEEAACGPSTKPAEPVATGGLLQFTSGSTGRPKAVWLGQDNLAANCAAIGEAYRLDRTSIGFHWLPLHHDMGLIGAVLANFWCGGQSNLMKPALFLQQPLSWWRYVAHLRARITSAPNFAYETAVRAADKEDISDLDLSCLDVAITGSEPVRKETVERFMEKFGPQGVRRGALAASYGLAEATLFVSTRWSDSGPRYLEIEDGAWVVSLGKPAEGMSVSVVNPDTAKPCDAGEEGQIVLSGLSVGRVVREGEDWRRPSSANASIRTGDIGFLDEGELFITGRTENVLIIKGRNLRAEALESALAAASPGIIPGGVAAVGIEEAGSQALVVFVELERSSRVRGLETRLNAVMGSRFGVAPKQMVFLRRGTLPRTTSGKIRRSVLRSNYLAGAFDGRELRIEESADE